MVLQLTSRLQAAPFVCFKARERVRAVEFRSYELNDRLCFLSEHTVNQPRLCSREMPELEMSTAVEGMRQCDVVRCCCFVWCHGAVTPWSAQCVGHEALQHSWGKSRRSMGSRVRYPRGNGMGRNGLRRRAQDERRKADLALTLYILTLTFFLSELTYDPREDLSSDEEEEGPFKEAWSTIPLDSGRLKVSAGSQSVLSSAWQ